MYVNCVCKLLSGSLHVSCPAREVFPSDKSLGKNTGAVTSLLLKPPSSLEPDAIHTLKPVGGGGVYDVDMGLTVQEKKMIKNKITSLRRIELFFSFYHRRKKKPDQRLLHLFLSTRPRGFRLIKYIRGFPSLRDDAVSTLKTNSIRVSRLNL